MRYSHTRITTFEDCPLKYKYRYLDRLTATLGDTIEAFMGQRVHESLERLYRYVGMERVPELEDLAVWYGQNWEKNWENTIRIVKKDYTAADYRARGKKCLEDYYRRYSPFDQGRTIGLERRVGVELGEGREITGFIDRLVSLDGGVYEIHDYKTSGRLPTQEEADRDRQLALYQMAVQAMWSDVEEVELVWHYLVFDRELRSRRTREELEELKADVNGIIDTIESAKEFEPRPGTLCDWCEFRNVCPLWKHQYVTEDLPPDQFKRDDGVRLVDCYVALTREAKELEKRVEEVKKALVDFCSAFGYAVAFGTEKKISVKKEEHLRFPSTSDVRRKELEDILRATGWWDEFSSLNARKLESSLVNGELPEEVAERLRPFCEETESVRLYPSQIKSEEK